MIYFLSAPSKTTLKKLNTLKMRSEHLVNSLNFDVFQLKTALIIFAISKISPLGIQELYIVL